MAEPVVFLDRDGTLNVKAPEGSYVERPDQLRLIEGAREAFATLAEHARVVIVTNQRGVALGVMNEQDLAAVHDRLADLLGVEQLDVFSCPHDRGACDCRKPQPGLIERAFAEHPELDRSRSVMVGDSDVDVGAGRAAGLPTVGLGVDADYVAPDLASALPWILARIG